VPNKAHGTLVNAAEMVRRQCPVRTKLEDFFNILLKVGRGPYVCR
jgi:hypothetical protein